MVNLKLALEDMQTLIETESPSENLAACSQVVEVANQLLAKRLGSAGKVISVQGRDHLWWGAEQPKVLLLGHIDTVWPIGTLAEIPFAINGDKLTGPGCVDMKSGVVQGIHALAEINSDQVAFLLTTDEEIGSTTSRALIEQAAASAAAVLVLECAQHEALKTARKGTSDYKVIAHGLAAHAGLEPEKGINAGLAISEIALSVSQIGNAELGTTVTPTVIKAGTTTNTVPAEAELSIDVRCWSASEQQRVDQAIKSVSSKLPGIKIEVRGGINRPPMESKMSMGLYEIAQELAPAAGVLDLKNAEVGGASDGNFTAALGIPTIDGLGAVGAGSHARNEWVSVAAIEPRVKLLAAMTAHLLKSN
jgi:glutamate carboxypeptidase